LNHWILYLLVFYLFVMFTRGVVQMYIHSYGLYADTWSAWLEVILNLSITILCASQWGILGILLGKVISSTLIALFWKPYYLYRDGFHLTCWEYWRGMLPHYLMFFLPIALFYPLVHGVVLPNIDGLLSFLLNVGWSVAIYALTYLIILYFCTTGMKHFVCRIPIVNQWLNR
jgi:hypothetical protein